ncbi:MAG: hypothetical protein EBU31_00485 [Proteobacteria bacterium]|nr:hypothetical protein [Pseudomonadota bacterium]
MPTIGDIGQNLDLDIRQGATFGPHTVTLRNPGGLPVNITDWMFRGQVRKTAADATIAASFTFSIVSAMDGQFTFSIPATATAAITAGDNKLSAASQYVYDIEAQDAAGNVRPIVYGAAFVFREVTR